MLGYYETGGSGGLQWRPGYRPGCSPQEINARRYARRKKLAGLSERGEVECAECGRAIPAADEKRWCFDCRKLLEARWKAAEDKAALERKYRLRHGKGVKILV